MRITGSHKPSLTSARRLHAISMADGLRTARLGHVRAGWNQDVPKKGIVQRKSIEPLRDGPLGFSLELKLAVARIDSGFWNMTGAWCRMRS
ncbi:hypothetical protein G3N56_03665 [Desulfovibrio sulfodismutans]|uniref:Uncharacterized protein n=1 Tax=Desulfolutivibrio sulfodismutans TaxID=63561 RepID=A0A7K3NI26_9BACT|nr:hypothetical protein [Desulfolutivibrio sulfodismutans]NDY55838.1 hypothetical protein [Desulfolutivibrio sulfodismutans]QLA14241.1 hypothetical protein GD606_19205 [Desulfolutivibrio sulfodismutans DSM 3696]